MKNKFLYIFIVSSLFLSCKERKEKQNNVETIHLFNELAQCIESFSNSLSLIKDSAEYYNNSQSIEDSLIRIYYKYPPEEDMKLSEEENDSLIKLMTVYNEKRGKFYQKIFGKTSQEKDSLDINDTIKINEGTDF